MITPPRSGSFFKLQQFGHPLGDKPLITMIGMQEGKDNPGSISVEQWHSLHQEKIEQKKAFQTLSTNSKVVEVQDAGHAIHLEDPDAVINAIRCDECCSLPLQFEAVTRDYSKTGA